MVNQEAQNLFFNIGAWKHIIKILETGLHIYVRQKSAAHYKAVTRKNLLKVFQQGYQLLTILIKGNPEFKKTISNHLELFLKYSEVDVGQATLITEILTDNPVSKIILGRNLLDHFVEKILVEGRQVRFLNFFKVFLEGKSYAIFDMILVFLNHFLPFKLNGESNENALKLLYSYHNPDTKSNEFYLKDKKINFTELGDSEISLYKDEPFLYHNQLIKIFLMINQTGVKETLKNRLTNIYKFSYLMRFLLEKDLYLDQREFKVNPNSVLETDRSGFSYARGITNMKPLVAKLIFMAYIKDSHTTIKNYNENKTVLIALMEQETIKLKRLNESKKMSENYKEYLKHIIWIFISLHHYRVLDLDDNSDVALQSFKEFLSVLLFKIDFLKNCFELDLFESWHKILLMMGNKQDAIILSSLMHEYSLQMDYTSNKIELISAKKLKMMTQRMRDTVHNITFKELLELFNAELQTIKNKFINEECDSLAQAINNFSYIVPKSITESHNINLNPTDFIQQIIKFLGDSKTDKKSRVSTFIFLTSYIKSSPNRYEIQRMLDSLGVTNIVLQELDSTNITEMDYLISGIDFLNSLLEEGNRAVQKSIYNEFKKNSKTSENFFKKVEEIFIQFNKIIKNESELSMQNELSYFDLIRKVMKLIQLFCENHYGKLQNYCKEQFNSRNNRNLLSLISTLIKSISVNPVKRNYVVLIQGLETLIELVQVKFI